jgi:hypothetical protein
MKIVQYAFSVNKCHNMLGQVYGYVDWWSVICALRKQDSSISIKAYPDPSVYM